MQEITLQLNQEVIEWLSRRALTERCTVEDFATVILTAVCINSTQKFKNHETEEIHETTH